MGTLTSIAMLHRLRLPSLSGHAGRAGAWIAYGWRRTGAPLCAGTLCVAIAIGLLLDARTMSRDNAALEVALRASAHTRQFRGTDPVKAVTQPDEFLKRLPGRSDLSNEVRRLFGLAQQNGLRLETGDYRANPDPAAGVLRYAITLPVRGQAASVQTFVLQALNQTPSLNLQGIAFKRGTLNRGGIASAVSPPIPSIAPLPLDTPDQMPGADSSAGASALSAGIAPATQLEPPLPGWATQSAVPSAASVAVGTVGPSPARQVSSSPRRPIVASSSGSAADLEARVSFVLLVRLQ